MNNSLLLSRRPFHNPMSNLQSANLVMYISAASLPSISQSGQYSLASIGTTPLYSSYSYLPSPIRTAWSFLKTGESWFPMQQNCCKENVSRSLLSSKALLCRIPPKNGEAAIIKTLLQSPPTIPGIQRNPRKIAIQIFLRPPKIFLYPRCLWYG